jgi:hypothetical protein
MLIAAVLAVAGILVPDCLFYGLPFFPVAYLFSCVFALWPMLPSDVHL